MADLGDRFLEQNQVEQDVVDAVADMPDTGPEAQEAEARDEEQVEEQQEGRERDEHGRFVAQAEEPETEEEQDYKALYERAEQDRLNLERKLGEQGRELGEHRQRDLPSDLNPEEAAAFEQALDDDPVLAAQWAYRNGHQARYATALEAVAEISQADAIQLAADLRIESQLGPWRQQQEQQATAASLAAVQAKYPDWSEQQDAIVAAADRNPGLSQQLLTGTPEQKQGALEALYLIANASRSPAPNGGSQDTSAEEARRSQDAARARDEAVVASASTSQGRETKPGSFNERWLAAFDEELAAAPKSVSELIKPGPSQG